MSTSMNHRFAFITFWLCAMILSTCTKRPPPSAQRTAAPRPTLVGEGSVPFARAPFRAQLTDRTLHSLSPSNARTRDGRRLPTDTFTALDQCSVCHADVFDQWSRSAHRFSSMDNPIYAPSFERARVDRSIPGTRFCGGCHDPALLFAGDIDGTPIARTHERASLGVGCVLCHSVERLHDRTGNGSYVLNSEPISQTIPTRNADQSFAPNTVAAHRARVVNDTIRSAEFCGTCHKVGLIEYVTHGPWLRGQNEFDAWQQSAFNQNDPSRYDPTVNRAQCIDCHMPLERATRGDVAATNGMVRSHRFLGGHTAMAALNHDDDTLRRQQQMLQNALRIDVFRTPDITGTGAVALDEAPARAGEQLKLDVVLVNDRVGHNFPAGTADVADVWVEVSVIDANNVVVIQSGLTTPARPTDEDAHFLLTRPVDERGVPAVMRDPHRYRGQAYDTTIPARAARVVRYEGQIPGNAALPLRVSARLLHRRIADPYWSFICQELQRTEHRTCPERPVTVVAEWTSAATLSPATPRWQRYYDHGRALAEYQVQERVAEATGSLEIARDSQTNSPAPLVELARIALRQSRVEDAHSLLDRAQRLDPRSVVPDYLRALASADVWRFSDTIAPLFRVRAANPEHPRTIELLANALGLEGRHNEALSLLFQGLNIDPERPQMLNLMAIELHSLQAEQQSTAAREGYERHRFNDGIPRIRTLCKRNIAHCQRESEPVHVHLLTAIAPAAQGSLRAAITATR